MLLAIDIGNTNIGLGVWKRNSWANHTIVYSKGTESEVKTLFSARLNSLKREFNEGEICINCCICSSVVPHLTQLIESLVTSILKIKVFHAKIDIKSPLKSTPPQELGQDLFANAVASYAKSNIALKKTIGSNIHTIPTATITVDLGTALTFTAVDKHGNIAGVAIFAGLESSFKSLLGSTAQLENTNLEWPDSALGLDTKHALDSGFVLGYAELIKGILERMKQELEPPHRVYATGGWSSYIVNLVAPKGNSIDYLDRMHTLDGLRILAKYNELIF